MSERELPVVDLCVYSKATGGEYWDEHGSLEGVEYEHLDECPLGLKSHEHKKCPCKRKVVATTTVAGSVRVMTCTYPELYNGDEIRNPAALAAWVRRQARG